MRAHKNAIKAVATNSRASAINAAGIAALSAFFEKLGEMRRWCGNDDGFPYPYGDDAKTLCELAISAEMFLPDGLKEPVNRALACLDVVQAVQELGAWIPKPIQVYRDGAYQKDEYEKDKDGNVQMREHASVDSAYRLAAVGIMIAAGQFSKKEET